MEAPIVVCHPSHEREHEGQEKPHCNAPSVIDEHRLVERQDRMCGHELFLEAGPGGHAFVKRRLFPSRRGWDRGRRVCHILCGSAYSDLPIPAVWTSTATFRRSALSTGVCGAETAGAIMCVSLASPRYHLHVLGYPRCDDERQATAEPYSLQLRRAPIFSANTRRLRVRGCCLLRVRLYSVRL